MAIALVDTRDRRRASVEIPIAPFRLDVEKQVEQAYMSERGCLCMSTAQASDGPSRFQWMLFSCSRRSLLPVVCSICSFLNQMDNRRPGRRPRGRRRSRAVNLVGSSAVKRPCERLSRRALHGAGEVTKV
ncbi:hypothetical protein RRG08_038036 [Elysia crispata]|uniref:Uncharacterized protein n=1 Tax=Elysia crispata TaxID=231223 RepID=A0AAE0ZZE4_9GAST|nr:hypothetical protein RRG08_038036 [Elysia crispata]